MVTELQAEHRSTEGIIGAEYLASVNYGCIQGGRGLAGDMEELHRCSGQCPQDKRKSVHLELGR